MAGHWLKIEQSVLIEQLFVVASGFSVRIFIQRVPDSKTYGKFVDHEVVEFLLV